MYNHHVDMRLDVFAVGINAFENFIQINQLVNKYGI